MPLPATGTASSGSGARRVAQALWQYTTGMLKLSVNPADHCKMSPTCPPQERAYFATRRDSDPGGRFLSLCKPCAVQVVANSAAAGTPCRGNLPQAHTKACWQHCCQPIDHDKCQSQLLRAGCATCTGALILTSISTCTPDTLICSGSDLFQ
jgi:hypothetical protein